MDDYSNVTLVKITEERTVNINGDTFLIIDTDIFNTLKTMRASKSYTDTTELQEQIVFILKQYPGIRSGLLRGYLGEKYDVPPNDSVMRSCLQRMKEKGIVRLEGERNKARWFVIDK